MIKLRITTEAMTDLMTAGVCGPLELVEGLPRNLTMVGVEFIAAEHNLVEYTFDDGLEEESVVTLKFIKPVLSYGPGAS